MDAELTEPTGQQNSVVYFAKVNKIHSNIATTQSFGYLFFIRFIIIQQQIWVHDIDPIFLAQVIMRI